VCTPHAHMIDVAELPDRVRQLRSALAAAGIDLEIRAGAELSWDHVARFDDRSLEAVAQGPPDRRWILLEAPLPGTGGLDDFELAAQELRDRGYGLLLAHPERSRGILPAGIEQLGPELLAGAVIAANVGPLNDRETPERHAASLEILGRGMVGVIATDAHAPRRPWTLAEGRAAVLQATGDAVLADGLTAANPASLLRDGIAIRTRARAA
jgi:protein-tyrosine phosphatase